MASVREFPITLVKVDPTTQPRTKLDEEAVERYHESINAGVELPPVVTFFDGEHDWLADGYLRLAAHKRAGRDKIKVLRHTGFLADAQWYSYGANKAHGLPLTKEDKAHAIRAALAHAKSKEMSDNSLAEHLGVHQTTVSKYRRELSTQDNLKLDEQSASTCKTVGRDGKLRNTKNIGRRTPVDDSLPDTGGNAPPPDSSAEHETIPLDEPVDYGKCPNCASTKWTQDEFGVACAKCHHPFGEPTGGADEDRVAIQRSKAVKTCEALMRAFDDLQTLVARPEHGEAIRSCKALLKTARAWK